MMIVDQGLDHNEISVRHIVDRNCISNFSCGVREIDNWLKSKATKFHNKGRAKVFIARHPNVRVALGFYSLSFSLQNSTKLVSQDDRDAWKDGAPLIYLDYVGVQNSYQGYGLGQFLLIDALKRANIVFENVAVYGVALRSLNDRTTEFYKKFGFGIAPEEDNNPLMILPIWSVVDLFGGGV